MLRIAYRTKDQSAFISWDEIDSDQPWLPLVRTLFSTASPDAQVEGGNAVSLPWWCFVGLRFEFGKLMQSFQMRVDQHYEINPQAVDLLRQSARNTKFYKDAISGEQVCEQELLTKLRSVGFSRVLKPHQIRNVRMLAALPAGATFSVPGAGKTTEALATFTYRRQRDERLLIIAPKNAFAAWDEQLQACFPNTRDAFVRLRGSNIARALQENPTYMIISYQQVSISQDIIIPHLAQYAVHVFLDESHRIKAGSSGKAANAILSLSQFPVGKMVMSGTPMPQSRDDLLPQFSFLYPEIPANADNVVEKMRPIYVRTNKGELGLPPVTHLLKTLPMSPLQLELYRFMKSEVARQATVYLSDQGRQAFRSLGRSVMRLLMFVSHPALLSREIDFAKPGMLSAVLAEGKGPKMSYVLQRARELVHRGEKVLIWSSFRHNVEYIAASLQDLGAVYIHGGVDAGSEDDDGTREGKIKLFHDDENVNVMVANPAAASEGVSLHGVCHHALYLDRTFNAAHFLQSMDRIHRLGLPPNQKTTIEVVQCTGSIDETVQQRLTNKIDAMAAALNDTTLRIDPIPMDSEAVDNADDWSLGGMDAEDVQTLLRDLSGTSYE